MKMKRPRDWRIELRPIYESDGKSIGRMLMYDRSKEASLWEVLGPTKIWPRWYLYGFATLYKEDNPREYERFKKNRQNARKRAARMANELELSRERVDERLRGQ